MNYRYNWALQEVQRRANQGPAAPLAPVFAAAASARRRANQPAREAGASQAAARGFPTDQLGAGFRKLFGSKAEYYSSKLYDVDATGKLRKKTAGVLTCYRPPDPSLRMASTQSSSVISQEDYNLHKLYVIAPLQHYKREMKCPGCDSVLTTTGWYPRPRVVVGNSELAFTVAEYYACKHPSTPACGRFIGWDESVLGQILPGKRRHLYPITFTWRLAVETKVFNPLRLRSLGNSPTLIHKHLLHNHSEAFNA
jgi:hypothetical protein